MSFRRVFLYFFRRAKAELKRSTRPSKKEKEIKIHITFSEQQSSNKKGLFSPSLSERVPFSYFSCEGKYKRGGGNIAEISVAFREREGGGGGELSPPSPPLFLPLGCPPPFIAWDGSECVHRCCVQPANETARGHRSQRRPRKQEQDTVPNDLIDMYRTLYMHFMSRVKHSFEKFFLIFRLSLF